MNEPDPSADAKPDVSVERFELHAPYESEATSWSPGSAGELRIWIKNGGAVLMDYPSVVVEPTGEGLSVENSEAVLYGIGDSTQVTWTLRSAADQAPGTKHELRVRVFAYSSDLHEGKAPVARATITLEVGQNFAR